MEGSLKSSILANRYQLHSDIGHGGSAHVYTAWDTKLERTVAIKRILATGLDDDVEKSAWKEAMRLASLHHSNIVSIYDMGVEDDVPFMVLEYVQGDTIEARVRREVFQLEEFRELAHQCLDGLMAAHHAGLIHRDIKPANIMLSVLPSGVLQVKILDFGIAQFQSLSSESTLNNDGTITGSIHCISPEQLSAEPVDVRSDLYSLGCVFYFALAGRYPFNAPEMPAIMDAHLDHRVIALATLRPDLPELLCQWVMVLINRRPVTRYQNGAQALAALEAIYAQWNVPVETEASLARKSQRLIPPPPASLPEAPVVQAKKRTPFLAIGAGLVLAGIVGGLGWKWSQAEAPKNLGSPLAASPKAGARPAPVDASASAPTSGAEVLAKPPEPAPPEALPAAASVLGPLKPETPPVVEAEARVLLRLHGSNTIGSKLLPALMERFLQKEGATGIERRPGKDPDEQTLRAQLPEIGWGAVEIAAHGSTTAFEDLKALTCEIGMSSRPIKSEELAACAMAGLGNLQSVDCEHVLGLDGVAILVSRKNPLKALSREQIAGIFSGKLTNWSEVGGAAGVIEVLARDNKSGTFDTFKSIVLGSAPLAATAKRFEDSTALSETVAANENAIGFAGLAFVGEAKVLGVSEPGSPPFLATRFTVATEDYALSRRLFLYTPQNPQSPWVSKFVEFALSPEGQEIVSQIGFVKQTIDLQRPTPPAGAPADYLSTVKNADRLSLNFRFRSGSVDLDTKAVRDLDRVVQLLAEPRFQGRELMLLGFTDGLGASSNNLKVSKVRATGVAQHLIARGVHPKVISGFGATSPVAGNDTQLGRDKNRRVEVWLR